MVVDHGVWTPDDCARWRATATDAGAISVLVYLEEVSHEQLWGRARRRNAQREADPNSIYFAESEPLPNEIRTASAGRALPHLSR
ncbi:hypothetical protein ABT224_35650 [Streptomyces sp. NPDC001584]|uniref:hypothetical protein n=1 Tax=Streptomyces sp. NPDC001584 TaxID=3154521 RepID=UPI00331D796F